MYIIVRKGNIKTRINMNMVRKYWDNEIKFANDHIIKVHETSKEIDLMVWAAEILKRPVDLITAEALNNEEIAKNNKNNTK